MVCLYIVEQSALEIGGHYYAYTSCVASCARKLGLDVVILANKRLKDTRLDGTVEIVPTFTCTWAEAETVGSIEWGPGNIAYELDEAFRRRRPASTDHVFLHTLAYREFESLLSYLANRAPTEDLPYFHILLRYDPENLANSIWYYKPYLQRIGISPFLRRKVLFHSDTDLLSREFSKLTMLPFATAPIPFLQELLLTGLARREPRAGGDALTVAYLGDAREEKGYQFLPAALSYLWDDYVAPGKLRFVLQSNFNTPGGEQGIMKACQALSQFPGTALIQSPLSPEEYYDVLAGSDIVLIPYSPKRYRYRSSGILIEAMAAGKVIVTSAGSWMATKVSPAHAVLFAEPKGIGPAIAECAEKFALLSCGAQECMESVRKNATGSKLVKHLIDCAAHANPPATSVGAPRILLIMNGDAMVLNNGATRVAEAQSKYLIAAGYRVVTLFLTYDFHKDDAEFSTWRQLLLQRMAPYAVETILLAGPGKWRLDPECVESAKRACDGAEVSILSDLRLAALFDFSSEVIKCLHVHRIDAVLLNYITNYPIVEALGLTEVPVICEMHDICSFQKAIYGGHQVKDEDLSAEFAYLDRCSALISLNFRETAFAKERLAEAYIETTGIFLPPARTPIACLAGSKDLAEVVSSCAPRLPVYRFETAWQQNQMSELFRLLELKSLDLLCVSSAHLANYSGIKWFLDEVYERYLAPAGISMLIAGSICRISDAWPRHPRLFLVDQVEDLAPLYSVSRVVVLPIVEGAGSPVKTLEALSYGRPVVATSTALRGLGSSTDELIIRDDAEGFADAIAELLQSQGRWRQAASESLQAYERERQISGYFEIMDRVFAHVLPGTSLSTPRPDPEIRRQVSAFDWNSGLQQGNRLIRSYLDGEGLEWWALEELSRLKWPEVEQLITEITDSLLVKQDAPIIKTEQRVAASVARFWRYQSVEVLVFAIRVALNDYLDVSPTADWDGSTIRAIMFDGLAIQLCVAESPGGGPSSAIVNGVSMPMQTRRFHAAADFVVSEATLSHERGLGLGVVEAKVSYANPAPGLGLKMAMLLQDVPVRADLAVLKQKAFSGDWLFSPSQTHQAELLAGATGSLLLPRLAADRCCSFVDFVFVNARNTDLKVSVLVADQAADVTVIEDSCFVTIRMAVNKLRGLDFGYIPVSITNPGHEDPVRLASIHIGLIFGNVELGLGIVARNRRDRFASLRSKGLNREAIRDTLHRILRGLPPTRMGRDLLAAELARVGGRTELFAAVTQAILVNRESSPSDLPIPPGMVDCCMADIIALINQQSGAARSNTHIVSPSLSASLHDSKDAVLKRWQATAYPTPLRSWRLVLPPAASGGKIKIALQGDFNERDFPNSVKISGFYEIEQDERGRRFRWTGPGDLSTIRLPLVLVQPATIVLTLGNLGANPEAQDLLVTRDGFAVDHELRAEAEETLLVAHLPAVEVAMPTVAIGIRVANLHTVSNDPRSLGITIISLSLSINLGNTKLEDGTALVMPTANTQAVEAVQMVAATTSGFHQKKGPAPRRRPGAVGRSSKML